jgi:hypothetical protein
MPPLSVYEEWRWARKIYALLHAGAPLITERAFLTETCALKEGAGVAARRRLKVSLITLQICAVRSSVGAIAVKRNMTSPAMKAVARALNCSLPFDIMKLRSMHREPLKVL